MAGKGSVCRYQSNEPIQKVMVTISQPDKTVSTSFILRGKGVYRLCLQLHIFRSEIIKNIIALRRSKNIYMHNAPSCPNRTQQQRRSISPDLPHFGFFL